MDKAKRGAGSGVGSADGWDGRGVVEGNGATVLEQQKKKKEKRRMYLLFYGRN